MDDCRPPLMRAETLSTIIPEASREAPRMIGGANDTTQLPAAKKRLVEEGRLARAAPSTSSTNSEKATTVVLRKPAAGRVAKREESHAQGAEEIEQSACSRGRYAADRNPRDVITTLHSEGSL